MKPLALLTLLACLSASIANSNASDSIVTEGVVSAPVAAVWNAWTTTAGLTSWMAPHADIDLRIDGRMRSNYDPKGSLGDPGTIENKSPSGCCRSG